MSARMMWGFNKAVMTGVIKPTSRVYRFVVAKPIRTCIGSFGKNLTYPGRLINYLLQAKWTGARDETYLTPAQTDISPGHTFAAGVQIYLDFAIKWVWLHPFGSRCRPRFQKIDAIPAMRQKSEIKPRNTRTG